MQSPWHPITLSTRSAPMKLDIVNVETQGNGDSTVVTIHYRYRDERGARLAISLEVSGNDGAQFVKVPVATLAGDLLVQAEKDWQDGSIRWQAGKDWPNQHSTQLKLRLNADDRMFLVIDVSGGPDVPFYPVISYNQAPPDMGVNEEYKTSKIVVKRLSRGRFTMGDNDAKSAIKAPEHPVVLTRDFYMGVFEITQSQWERVMGDMPAKIPGEKRPIENVSWDDVRGGSWPNGSPALVSFLGKLRAKTSMPFDLPTEAQWEYSCRAGTSKDLNMPQPEGTDISVVGNEADPALEPIAWYSANSMDPENRGHRDVGGKIPNAWGLYDMHGNVYEWVLDWYGNYESEETDPVGSTIPMFRVFRGGSWFDLAKDCAASSRKNNEPTHKSQDLGFRLSLLPNW
jgi:sulfatase modifying factor 1